MNFMIKIIILCFLLQAEAYTVNEWLADVNEATKSFRSFLAFSCKSTGIVCLTNREQGKYTVNADSTEIIALEVYFILSILFFLVLIDLLKRR